MSFPEKNSRATDCLGAVASEIRARVPHDHLVQRDTHGAGRIATEVLIREEECPPALGEGPLEHFSSVRAGAHQPAMPAAEGFQLGCRIDVGYGHEIAGVDDLTQVGPGGLDTVQ